MDRGKKTLARWAVASLMVLSANFMGVPSHAHDDYPWVRNPKYLTATGAHCCSERDCQPAAPGDLTPTANGWRHNPTGTEISADKPGVYQTEDRAGRVFHCVWGGKLVCVFEGSST